MWWWRWFTYIEHICWYVWLSVVAVWLAGRNCYVVIGGVGVLTLTLGVLVKNVVSSEPSVHYDLRPGVCWDILGPRWGFTRKFRVITEQSSWLLTQVTLTALSHLSSLYRCSSQGLLWSAGRRIWGWGSILLECLTLPSPHYLTPGPAGLYLTSCLPGATRSRHRVQVMIHDWWSDPVSPSLTRLSHSQDPARPPWRAEQSRAHATKQTFWLVNTNIPATPLAASPPSCTDGPISRKFWLVLWWSTAWQRRLTRSHLPWEILPLLESVLCRSSIIRSLCQQWSLSRHTTSIIAVSSHKIIIKYWDPSNSGTSRSWTKESFWFEDLNDRISPLLSGVVIVMLHWSQEMFQSFHSGSRQVIRLVMP